MWDSKRVSYADLALGTTTTQTNLSANLQYNWRLDIATEPNRHRKLELGVGARFTSSSGGDAYFTSVQPQMENPLYQTGTFPPQPKYLPGNNPAYSDSVHFSSTQVSSINFMIHMGYFFSNRLSMGVNSDFIGWGFGGTRTGTYINGSVQQQVTASPERYNYLFGGMGGSQSQGALFGEFYIAYDIGRRWSVKWGLTHRSSQEFITTTMVQQYPEPNNRFRNEELGGTLGVMFKLTGQEIKRR